MPDTFGKRQRQNVKAKKAAEREERRVARNQRREERAGDGQSHDGLEPDGEGETELDEKA
ncbi:MAG: hypothetical protein ACT4PO_12960 [Actinomycetota bacterium]